ncbi:MAG: thioredoxin domain-containing protein [Pirellulales bacterium]|nr:thioredoxin domain-containing protein [Pirellulales bacterium]
MATEKMHIPLPGRAATRPPCAGAKPAFPAPVRWLLTLLAWAAFLVTGYLAYLSMTGGAIAGCGVGTENPCDAVLSSSWSKWLGLPVAIIGLCVYASLAVLGLFLGIRRDSANRTVTTAFVLLAVIAATASVWFVGVQALAIGKFCKFCLATDACGITLGILAVAAALQCRMANRSTTGPARMASQPAAVALRPATAPRVPGIASPTMGRPTSGTLGYEAQPPSLLIALGGALLPLAMLIGGQLLFPSKNFQVEKVALTESIDIDSGRNTPSAEANGTEPGGKAGSEADSKANAESSNTKEGETAASETEPESESADAASRYTLRVPTPAVPAAPAETSREDTKASPSADSANKPPQGEKADNSPAEPPKSPERFVKFLGGKLSLDVYRHPLIGSPDAPHVAIEMVSYDCLHCRQMHSMVEQAMTQYGNEVALIVMPIPLDYECNKLLKDSTLAHRGACGTARTVLGFARLNPERFRVFHEFLMSGGDKPPPMERIIPKAFSYVDGTELFSLARSNEVKKQLDGYITLFDKLQRTSANPKTFGLPVQVLGDKIMSGKVEKREDLFKAWEENLGLKPRDN